MRGNGPGRVQVAHQKDLLIGKGSQALEWAAQEADGVTVLAAVQEIPGCGT